MHKVLLHFTLIAAVRLASGLRQAPRKAHRVVVKHAHNASSNRPKHEFMHCIHQQETNFTKRLPPIPPVDQIVGVSALARGYACPVIVKYSNGLRVFVKSSAIAGRCKEPVEKMPAKARLIADLMGQACVPTPRILGVIENVREYREKLYDTLRSQAPTMDRARLYHCIQKMVEVPDTHGDDRYVVTEVVDGVDFFPRLGAQERLPRLQSPHVMNQIGRMMAVDFVVSNYDRFPYGTEWQKNDECHLLQTYTEHCGSHENLMYDPRRGAVAIDNEAPFCLESLRTFSDRAARLHSGMPPVYENSSAVLADNKLAFADLRDATKSVPPRLSKVALAFNGYMSNHVELPVPDEGLHRLQKGFAAGLNAMAAHRGKFFKLYGKYAPETLLDRSLIPEEVRRAYENINLWRLAKMKRLKSSTQ